MRGLVVRRSSGSHCEEPYPARAAVGVATLPKGARLEIDAIMEAPQA